MSRLHLLIVCLFAVALGTGIVIGMGVARGPLQAAKQGPDGQQHPPGGWLNLSPEQGQQIKAIWSAYDEQFRKNRDVARPGLRNERNVAAMALLTPEQKTALDKINDQYDAQIADLKKSEDAAFNAATEKTKALLTPEQYAKYEDGLKKRGFRGGPSNGHGGPGTRPEGGHGPGGPGGGGPGGAGGNGSGDRQWGHDGDRGPWARPSGSEATSQPAEAGK